MKKIYIHSVIPISVILICAFLLVSPQIYKHALIVSNDWLFHMNRFYETAMQIKEGTFNYFQSIYGFDQSARIINALYGTDFAYLNGLILLLAGNWFRFQIFSTFSCYFIAGVSMYSLARYINLNKILSTGAALLYMGTPTIFYYALAQNFSGWGAAFLPIIFIPAIKMIKDQSKPINPIILGISVSLLIATHMFSTLLAVIALIPFFICGFVRSEKKLSMLKDALLAILIAVGLSFNTFAAYLDVSGNRLITPYPVSDMLSNSTSLSSGSIGWTNFGLILSLIFIFQILFIFIQFNQIGILEKTITLTGALFLLISSKYLPWNSIGNHFTFIRKIQFPQRFGCIACILLIIGFCLTVQKLSKQLDSKLIIDFNKTIFMSIALLNLTGGYALVSDAANTWNSNDPLSRDTGAAEKLETDPNNIRKAFGGLNSLDAALNIYRKPTSDYLPAYSAHIKDSYGLYRENIYDNKISLIKNVTHDGELQLTFYTDSTDEIILPVIIYTNTTVKLNGEKLKEQDFSVSPIGALKLQPQKGENTIFIGYKPNFLFKISFLVRITTILTIVVCFIVKRKKHYNNSF